MKKKLLTFFMTFTVLINVNAQQWIEESSCNKNAFAIVNEAITSLSNVESLIAVGMAKAALVVDKDCECAKLVMAAAAGDNENSGSRSEKLKSINVNSLSDVEKAWHTLLSTSDDDFEEAAKKALKNYPNSPLIHWLNAGQDMQSTKAFAQKFPLLAAGAYNTMAYAYAKDGDFESAYKALDNSLRLHNGPNVSDSRAEIAAMQGDYQEALNNQFKAFNEAAFGSPYQRNLVIYWRNLNKEDLVKSLQEAQVNFQNAILKQDLEEYNKYVIDEMMPTSGDSNLKKFYTLTKETLLEEKKITWDSFDFKDFDIDFSPDMNTAIVKFYSNGVYTINDSKEKVEYSTRASAVWISTESGWKIVHSNWAPFEGSGIPK